MCDNYPPDIKIVLLGNCGVGKRDIISRYIDNTYEEYNSSTIGANYSEKIIKKDNKEYQLNIWDTAGQEKFHSLVKHYYKGAYIFCLVYDITNQESFESLKTIWYPDLLKYGEKYIILAVVGSKGELYESDYLVDENKAKFFADEIGATFHIVSAKNGDGIEKLFNTLVDKYISPEFNSKLEEMLDFKAGNIKSLKLTKSNSEKGPKKKKEFC